MESTCKDCGVEILVYNSLRKKCYSCSLQSSKQLQTKTPLKPKGDKAYEYDKWRDEVAKPYLDTNFGIACAHCGILPTMKRDGTFYRHSVDHIIKRSLRPDLVFDLTNVQYLCNLCHTKKDID